MTTAREPGYRIGDRLLDRVVGGQPGVGQRGDVLGVQRRVELDDRARVGLEQLGEAAVDRDPREQVVRAVHVVAGAAGAAQAAGDQRVDDHGVADLDVGDGRADLVDPAGVLVAEHVGQLDAGLLGPLALLDVQVGAAQPGAADAHDHVVRPGDLGLGDLLDGERLVVLVQARGDHAGHLLGRVGDAVADVQQRAADAAVALQAQAHEPRAAQPHRQVRGGQRGCRRRRRARARRRRAAGRARGAARGSARPRGRRRAQVGDAQVDDSPPATSAARRSSAAHSRGPGARAAPCAGTARAARRGRRRSRPGTRRRELAAAGHGGVDLVAGVVVVEHHAHRAARPARRARRARVGRHQEREVRRALRGRQAQAHVDVAAGGHDARADEAERGDRLVELGVVDRGERREHLRLRVTRRSRPAARRPGLGRRARPRRQLQLLRDVDPVQAWRR